MLVKIIAASDVSVHLTAQDGSQEIRIFVSDPRYGPNAIENLVAVALHELGHIWCCQGPSASDDGHWLVATPDPELTGVDRFGLMNHPVRCLVFGVVWSCPNRFSRRELDGHRVFSLFFGETITQPGVSTDRLHVRMHGFR